MKNQRLGGREHPLLEEGGLLRAARLHSIGGQGPGRTHEAQQAALALCLGPESLL